MSGYSKNYSYSILTYIWGYRNKILKNQFPRKSVKKSAKVLKTGFFNVLQYFANRTHSFDTTVIENHSICSLLHIESVLSIKNMWNNCFFYFNFLLKKALFLASTNLNSVFHHHSKGLLHIMCNEIKITVMSFPKLLCSARYS